MTASAPATHRARPASSVTGTGSLLRVSLRAEIRSLAPWMVVPTILTLTSVLGFELLGRTEQERQALNQTIAGNPALGLIFGPAGDVSTLDGFNAWRGMAIGGFVVALGAILVVVKATRAQEDSGQAEFLAAGVMGRNARLLTALAMCGIMSLVAGVLSGVITAFCGVGWESSLLLGAGFTATGWLFGALAGVTAQLAGDARAASSAAIGALGVFFILRGFFYAVDVPGWLVWINPLCWVQETHPAEGGRWWPLALVVVLAVVLAGAAFAAQSARDFGQGIFATPPGPDRGRVHTPLGLMVRLNRSPLVYWALAFAGLGVVFGYFIRSMREILEGNPFMAQLFAHGASSPEALSATFVATIASLVGIIVSIPGVQTVNRIRTEELEDHAEPVLAGAVTRSRYFGAGMLVALGAPVLYVLIAGSVMGLFGMSAGIGLSFADVLLQTLAVLPAVWAVIGVAAFIVGVVPVARVASWLGVVGSLALTLLGPSLKLPNWLLGFSPFYHVPPVALADPDLWGLLWVGVIAVGLVVGGFAGFRRRDIP
ncbi:ABC transporter permease [Gordonia sp. VNK21]|uniref:ABC transporter permease n=1 Tax=Gordonia sp. VNK21 TaxID=3382483 RepID=UPI0038D41A8C